MKKEKEDRKNRKYTKRQKIYQGIFDLLYEVHNLNEYDFGID
jgi:hypothetical protein